MMVKVEEDHPAQPQPADPMMASPVDGGDDYYYFDDGDEEGEDEETDSEGDGDARQPKLKKGPWTPDEDKRLRDYVQANGEGNWNQVRINAGLNRCGKSCRLRWSNHLRPDLKKGPFDDDEVEKIIRMHMNWGNKWAKMAALLPGRTDNEIKNYWNTRLKRHQRAGLPIYPEYLVSQASNQDPDFGTPEALCGTKRPNQFSQNVLGITDLMNDYFDAKTFRKRCPLPNMGDTPCPSVVGQDSLPMDGMNTLKLINSSGCLASGYNGSHSFVQIPDETEKASCSTSFNYGMTDNQLAPPGNAINSSHPIFDGYPSTSWTTQRSLKPELPSVQYSNYGISNAWGYDFPSGPIEQADTLTESPGSLKSESISSQIAGLDAIVHLGDGTVDPIKSQGVFEASLPPFSNNQISQSNAYTMWHSFSSVPGDDEIEGCPLGEIQASKSPSSSDAVPAGSKCYPDTSFAGNHLSSWADIGTTFDASLDASLLNGGSLFPKDHSISTYDSLIDGDSSDAAKLSTAGHGPDSVPWNSMPGACNMPDFPNL